MGIAVSAETIDPLSAARACMTAGNLPGAVARLGDILNQFPLSAPARFALADARERQGRAAEAARQLRLAYAAALLQPVPADMPLAHAEALAALAEDCRARGHGEQAREIAEATTAARPDCAEAHLALARVRYDVDEMDGAGEAVARALALRPDMEAAHLLAAENLAGRGHRDEAIAALFAARRAAAGSAAVEVRLGELLRSAGRPTEAAAAFRRALDRRPDDAGTARALSATYRDLGRHEDALTWALRALELAPDSPWIHVQVGNAHAALGSAAQAASAYRGALERDFRLPGVALALAEQCVAAENPADAVAPFHLAAAEAPGDGALMLRIARLHDGLGQPGEAIPWYRRALGLGLETAAEGLEAALAACGPNRRDWNSGDERLADAVCRIPALAGRDDLVCTPLDGGFQNRIYRVRGTGDDFVLRLERFPPAYREFFAEDARNAALAHRAGLAPGILYADEADGTMLSRFVDGRTLDLSTIGTDGRPERLGHLYRTLHSGPAFIGTYDIFTLIDDNLSRLEGVTGHGLPELAENVALSRRLLADNRVAPVPCHNDPVPANLIDTGDAIILVDWQCSGMTDPHWEIGALSAQGEFSPEQEERFFTAYFGDRDHPAADRARLYKAVCHAFWLTRALVQKADGEAKERWREDLDRHRRRLGTILAQPVYGELLDRVARYRA